MFINSENSAESIKSLRAKSKDLKILLVEDDPLIRKEYMNFFGRIFDNIDNRNNGKEGLEATLDKEYDLIMSDVQMPVMDGLEMIDKIKQMNSSQSTLLISASHDSDILHSSVKLGVDGYIFKPIQIKLALEVLDKIVSKILMQKENTLYKQNLEELVIEKSRQAIETYTVDGISKLYSLAKFQQDIIELHNNSLAVMKIKNFKVMNDFYGYDIGDNILKQTADLLNKIVIKNQFMVNSTLYRLSGTHFAILSPLDGEHLEQYIEKIIQEIESTEVDVNNQLMYLEMNAGIVSRKDEITLAHADSALRIAEKNGKIVIYKRDENLVKLHASQLQCNDMIKRALIENRFVPFYHPIVDNKTNKIKKYEALARLIMLDGEVIFPSCFLPVSKKTKTYNMITVAIIGKALEDFRDSKCSVSLNISVDDINHKATREFIFEQIAMFPEPSRLVFELLESENIESYKEVKRFLTKLQQHGCKIAIDDFGSGYANFEHIAKLNVDYIKIDGSLILGIENELLSLTIVEMLSTFALKMGIKTIAEYVSSDIISNIVNSIGVNESQGFLFGEPIPYNDSMRHIQSSKLYNK
ncbi:MAG: EAL domain-containing protein [Sulfurimonas sp.]